jgi:general secretion pathway protein A
MTYAILKRKGFVVLTGDPGTGKTTLLARVLDRLPNHLIESSIILNPTLTPAEFLELVMLQFDIQQVPVSKAQRLWKLQQSLSALHQQGKISVLVIDEAHKLSVEVLEEIRLLANLEYATDKFLQIVLLGQPELDDLLDRQDARQFKQRIAVRLYLDALAPAEAEEYIKFRWMEAGATEPLPFTAEALQGIIQWSRGVPRWINSLCDTAILLAYAEGSQSVGVHYAREAANRLGLVETAALAAGVSNGTAISVQADHHPGLEPASAQQLLKQNGSAKASNENHTPPNLAGYSEQSVNSSVFRRLPWKLRPSPGSLNK